MQTTIFQVKFHNGAVFNVFCSGRNQVQRFKIFAEKNKTEIESIVDLLNGIHTIKQFEQITTNRL